MTLQDLCKSCSGVRGFTGWLTQAERRYVQDLYLRDLTEQEVASSFIVEEKQLRMAKNGAPFLTLKLVDKTGQIAGRIWEQAEAWSQAIALKSVVSVRGRTELFREELQLQIFEISPVP